MSSEVNVSELINFVLRDSGMHVNIAIGIAYVSQLSFVVVYVVDVVYSVDVVDVVVAVDGFYVFFCCSRCWASLNVVVADF